MYAIVDWHATGDIATNGTNLASTESFWSTVSRELKGTPGVLYEIYNEPAQITWAEWQPYAQKIVNLIRKYDPNTVILVSGVSWSADLSGVLKKPVDGVNIAYVVHPYPFICSPSIDPALGSTCWDSDFGNTAALYPVFATEWGYFTPDQALCQNLFATWSGYPTALLNYMESKSISWSAFVWNPYGCPTMLLSWTNYEPTQFGRFVQHALTPNVFLNSSLQSFTFTPLSVRTSHVTIIVQPLDNPYGMEPEVIHR
jgi:hypothetical protein